MIQQRDTYQKSEVIYFIDKFQSAAFGYGNDIDAFLDVFSNGYCYYFAIMLKAAFNRGTVCIIAPCGHVVWVDTDGIAYDIYGEFPLDGESLIPEDAEDSHIIDFKHIYTEESGITDKELSDLVKKYKNYDPNSK